MLKKTIGMGGFTLAEVLITLGIIGVVAAMTMPTLINSTQGAQYKTAFKKSLTVLSQAVVMNIALNDYDLSQVVGGGADGGGATNATADAPAAGAQSLWDLFHNRLNIVRETGTATFDNVAGSGDQWIIVSDSDSEDRTKFTTKHGNSKTFPGFTVGDTWADGNTVIFMNDGIAFIFDNTQGNCEQINQDIGVAADSYCYAFIDVNGQKAPNRVVQCDNGSHSSDTEIDDVTCTVSNPTDIYPIALYNQSVVPASPAAKAVLYNK